jgi:SAM-dependent methyltransferase
MKHNVVPRGQPVSTHRDGADYQFALMGGYEPDDAYRSKAEFFARHLRAHPRLVAYDRYLQRRMRRDETVLSVASGRGANELQLVETLGCDITCSDLKAPPCLAATKTLFPSLKFVPIDVLRDNPPGVYDTVLSLSLIYAFNDQELERFFSFAGRALKPSGRLLLDLAGSPDNLPSYMLHDLFLPAEAAFVAAYRTVRHLEPHRVDHVPHGYRRSLADVVAAAERAGFRLVDTHDDGFDIDLRRGVLLNRLAATSLGLRTLTSIGRRMPYTRMTQFIRSANAQSRVVN